MSKLNPRIVRVGVQIKDDFQLFEGLDIRCHGTKVAGVESGSCIFKISNLTRTQKNFILTTATPMTPSNNPFRTPILVTLDVGRENEFEPFRLFQGFAWATSVTMPPDIGIILEATTDNLAASLMNPINFGALASLESISKQIAAYYGLTLRFTASPKMIANFHYTGGLQSALNKLALCGLIRVQLDGNILSVYDSNKTAGNIPNFNLNTSTGMIGIPEAIESGVKTKMLIRPEPQIGGPITIQSQVNPAVNGSYFICAMNFDVTSRDDPFWYDIFCSKNAYQQGVLQ